MLSSKKELVDIATSRSLTYQQKLYNLANAAERMISPVELLGYTEEEWQHVQNQMICDLNEGYILYRPRYIVPDYSVFVEKGCRFLELKAPKTLDDCLDGLLILYSHVPSITSFPVFIGHLDRLIDPFITDEKADYIKIKRFLNHIDKTITDSFCHADIGPEESVAGRLILEAIIELQNPTPNMSIKYSPHKTSDSFAELAAKACLMVSKPSFANDDKYSQDLGEYALASCYNALPLAGGAYTLSRLRLGTIVKQTSSVAHLIDEVLPKVAKLMLSTMDKRDSYIVEQAHFFDTNFLVKEGFLKRENFTSMFGIVGLADAVNYLLEKEGKEETFGQSERGDVIAHQIMDTLKELVENHPAPYCERTNERYLLHAQVGASLHEEDKDNTPAHRIRVGQEPPLIDHLRQSAPFHEYFPSGTGDLFAFDQTYLDHLPAVVDIIKGAFNSGYRYITTYLKNTDLIRVTGYLVKKSEVEKARKDQAVLRDTTWFGSGTDENAHVFERRERKDDSFVNQVD